MHALNACVMLALSGLPVAQGLGIFPELEVVQVHANDMVFDCFDEGPRDGVPVMMTHGFPYGKEFFLPLISYWMSIDSEFRMVACDLRGYSPGASPNNIEAYDYGELASDNFAIADSLELGPFHLIGHDHSGAIGWILATDPSAPSRVMTYTAMSISHLDQLSSILASDPSPNVPVQKQLSQFNQFALPDSATVSDGFLTIILGGGTSPDIFQRQMWWYAGAIPKWIAAPPVFTVEELQEELPLTEFAVLVASSVPLEPAPAIPQQNPVGNVQIPVRSLCGSLDTFGAVCSQFDGEARFMDGDYEFLEVECGHDMIRAPDNDGPQDQRCASAEVATGVHEYITDFLRKNSCPIACKTTSRALLFAAPPKCPKSCN